MHVMGKPTGQSQHELAATRAAGALGDAATRLLGDDVAAVFLHGSLTLGGYEPGRSDIDLLVVVERELTDDELGSLPRALAKTGSNPASAADLRVVDRSAVAMPAQSPFLELYVRLHGHEVVDLETRKSEPDLAVELSLVRSDGRSLVGPEPRALIGAVPDRWVVSYGNAVIERWQELTDDDEHAELMILTACRAWRFAVDGRHCSKAEAGCWALAQDGSLVAVEGALRRRRGEQGVAIDAAEIGRVLAVVHRGIAVAP